VSVDEGLSGSAQPTTSMGLSDFVTGLHYSSGEHDHFAVLRTLPARVKKKDQPFASIAAH
jgi:hypothetical protein